MGRRISLIAAVVLAVGCDSAVDQPATNSASAAAAASTPAGLAAAEAVEMQVQQAAASSAPATTNPALSAPAMLAKTTPGSAMAAPSGSTTSAQPAIAAAAPAMTAATTAADSGTPKPATVSAMPPDAAISGSFIPEAPETGWRWESSLGIELAVPADWTINETGCTNSEAPTIVRAQGVVADCGRIREPETQQIVEIMPGTEAWLENHPRPSDLDFKAVNVGAEPAERGEGKTPGGRAAGWLHIPGVGVVVDARVKDEETLHKVFDSVRIVDVDHNLCATARDAMLPAAPMSWAFVPPSTDVFSVCMYDSAILGASALLKGDDAKYLVERLNEAFPGPNADAPAWQCMREQSVPPPDVVLIAHAENDSARVQVTFSSCAYRGMNNGRTTAQVTNQMVRVMLKTMHSGFGGGTSLPD